MTLFECDLSSQAPFVETFVQGQLFVTRLSDSAVTRTYIRKVTLIPT